MKQLLVILLSFIFVQTASARPKESSAVPRDLTGWGQFDDFMKEGERRDKEIGWSYILSGVLVAAGGTLGAQATEDVGSKMVFGLSASLGVGAAGYGIIKLYNGSESKNFYETLKESSLSLAQKDELVRRYLMKEREKDQIMRTTRIVTHLVAAGLNFYAASQEKDQNAKNFLQLFAGVNCALALAYTF